MARIDTGRLSLYPRAVDVATVADRVVASVQHATTRTLQVQAAADLPTAFFDPDKLVQVLTNLVENGVAHGEGRVLVHLEPLPEEDPLRSPEEILDEIAALDAESAEVLAGIREML